MRNHGPYLMPKPRSPFDGLLEFLAYAALFALIIFACLSCTKQSQLNKLAKQNTSVAGTGLQIKLQLWLHSDSVLFSPSHPEGTIQQCYVKDSIKWFSYSGTASGTFSNITVQQNSMGPQDSISITIYSNGSILKQASAKYLLITSYTY